MPFYAFRAIQPSLDMSSAWSDDAGRKLAVFTSPRAVEHGVGHIQKSVRSDLEYAVIGPATRTSLERYEIKVNLQAQSGYTSEDLLKVPALARSPGEAVIFCAPGGRETLAKGLVSMGWKVTRALVYEREVIQPAPHDLDELLAAKSVLSVWTSSSAMTLAQSYLLDETWKKVLSAPALVISVRLQQYLLQLGASWVELSEGPGNLELLRSIQRLAGR
jgi:uroporphyrinogen-III synthase